MLTNPHDAFIGQARSSSTVPFHMLGIVSSCAIVTWSSRRAVFPIFDFKKCRDLEIRVRGHSRSLKVVPLDRLCMISYKCSSIETLSLRDIRLQKCRDHKNWVRGPSRSLEMSPCDRAHITSYWRSIANAALPNVISETFNVEKSRDLEIGVRGHSRSLKVASFDRLCMVSY